MVFHCDFDSIQYKGGGKMSAPIFTVRLLSSILFITYMAGGGPVAQAAEKKATDGKTERREKMSDESMAALSCFGYGYKLKVLVNGVDVGVAGGKSENRRLFAADSPTASQAPPEMRKKSFVLKKGENTISIEFTKQSDDKNDRMEISLEMDGYPAPLFFLQGRLKPSGKVEKSFVVSDVPPADFKPVFVTDQGDGKAVLVHMSSLSTSMTPVLNGKSGMTISDMPGTTVLDNFVSGKNELVLKYSGKAGVEAKFCVITPEGVKFLAKKITGQSEASESFQFVVK